MVKPRIYRSNGAWLCRCVKTGAYGATAAGAYLNWITQARNLYRIPYDTGIAWVRQAMEAQNRATMRRPT